MNVKCDIAHRLAPQVAVYEMEHSGYKASIMAAEKLPDNGKVHGLPQGIQIPAIPIACLPGCPSDWVREAGTYVVAVKPDIGLWFSWVENNAFTTAVVPSVKGQNPITGQKMQGGQMEQYRDCCPVHKTPFSHGRNCQECGYSWPPQNYVSSPDTLWWDGYFQTDGTVRQFFYTEDVAKDIATLSIGEENTMPAFGFAFFRYKREPAVNNNLYRGGAYLSGGHTQSTSSWSSSSNSGNYKCGKYQKESLLSGDCLLTKGGKGAPSKMYTANLADKPVTMGFMGNDYDGLDLPRSMCMSSPGASMEEPTEHVYSANASLMSNLDSISFMGSEDFSEKKTVSVGAGAAIAQKLSVDLRPLDDYHTAPQAVMRIYFVFEDGKDGLRDIISRGGIKPLEEKKSGFLNGLPIG